MIAWETTQSACVAGRVPVRERLKITLAGRNRTVAVEAGCGSARPRHRQPGRTPARVAGEFVLQPLDHQLRQQGRLERVALESIAETRRVDCPEPKPQNARMACSRDGPAPKAGPATGTGAPTWHCWFSTRAGSPTFASGMLRRIQRDAEFVAGAAQCLDLGAADRVGDRREQVGGGHVLALGGRDQLRPVHRVVRPRLSVGVLPIVRAHACRATRGGELCLIF